MTNTEKEIHSHLDSAKSELKSAAEEVLQDSKEKIEGVIGDVALKVSEKATEIHNQISPK